MFNKSSTFSKYINSPLVSIINIITTYSRITIRSDPNTSKIIAMNSIINKLTKTIFMNIDATCLTMMNFTLYYRWISSSFNFKSSNSVIVNIISFKKSLRKQTKQPIIIIYNIMKFVMNNYQSIIKCKNAHISTMMYMVTTHNRISMIFNPNTG